MHAISEIIMQANVRNKKLEQTPVFSDFGAIDAYGPKPEKHGSYPSQSIWQAYLREQQFAFRTTFLTGPYPIFMSCKRALRCCQMNV